MKRTYAYQRRRTKKKMYIACLPKKHIGVHMNSFKRVRAFQIELEFESVGFEERGKPDYPSKNLSEQGREPTTNLTHIWCQRRELKRVTLVGGECSHRCATLAPLCMHYVSTIKEF